MRKLTYSITEDQRVQLRAVFRQRRNRVSGETYLQRLVNLHRAEEQAAALRGSPDEVDSAEMTLVLQAAERLLARNPKTDYAGIIAEMDEIRRTSPPAGIPKKEHWLRTLLRFG